jgi:serine/threonine-protein kinase
MDNEKTALNVNGDGQDSDIPADASSSPTGIITDMVKEFHCSKCDCLIDVRGLTAFTEIECPKCSSIELVPARLGNFMLLKLLGTGGMGGVYYARDESLGRFVAIKVMLQKLGNDPEFIETFRREARAVAKLNHPNIAQIYSFGQEKGQPYIVMELVNGEHVDEMMEEEGGIPIPLAIRICYEVAKGLNAADEAGIVHGDIKPENIMLDKNGQAKVVDFGLATVAHAAAEEGIWGTPYYIAPEKIRRQDVDARADIYSLGATLYHIIAGNPPFEGETPVEVVKARLEHPAPNLKKVRKDVPDIVANIVKRMLATERTARYPTYKSLMSDLRKAINNLDGSSSKTSKLGGKQIRFKNKKNKASLSSVSNMQTSGPILNKKKPGKNKIVIRKDKVSPSVKLTAGSKKSFQK